MKARSNSVANLHWYLKIPLQFPEDKNLIKYGQIQYGQIYA